MSQSEVREIWQMGPLGYPFLYDTQLPNFPNFHFRRRQWMRLTASAVSDRFTSYPTYIEKRAGQWLATRVRPGKKNVVNASRASIESRQRRLVSCTYETSLIALQ